jgi:hypothetical protein
VVRRASEGSKIVEISPTSHEDLSSFLTEVGARLSDVFGADSILWVEGKTEEVCFPELIRDLANESLLGTQILGVVSTDELAVRHASRVFEIYSRISGGSSLLPPAIAFIFDREDRSDTHRADMERKSGNLLQWLPLKMYENYLLEPEAIASVINSCDTNRSEPLTALTVKEWLSSHGTEKRYFGLDPAIAYTEPKWVEVVKGSLVLADIFSTFTETRCEYNKVNHGLLLTRYLIDHPTQRLHELASMLVSLLKSRAASEGN